MKLALFGASGRTGRLLLDLALAAGHDVAALVSSPLRLPVRSDHLTVVTGDARTYDAIAATVAGAEAVISVLGPRSNRPERAITQATKHLLNAMRFHGVRRLVVSTGAGVGDPHDRPTLLHHAITVLLKLTARNVLTDMAQMAEVVRASDLDWTIVRVPMLTDGPGTGAVRVGYVGQGTGPRLARADLAAVVLQTALNGQHLRAAPVVSN